MNGPWAAVVRKKDQENKAMTCKRSQNPCGISGVEVSPLAFRAMDNLLEQVTHSLHSPPSVNKNAF